MIQDPDEMLQGMGREDPSVDDPLSPVFTFTVDVKDRSGRRYQGSFTAEVPKIGDQITIGQLKAKYLPQGAVADPNANMLVEMICYLAITLKEKPPWWKPIDFFDDEPITSVYQEVRSYEHRFRSGGKDEAGNSGRSSESDQHTEVGSADMGRKVRPPAERSETIVSHSSRSV